MKNITYTVPKNNSEIFVFPAIDCIPDLVRKNKHKIHTYTFEINGIPFMVLRDKIREELIYKAKHFSERMQSLFRSETNTSDVFAWNSAHKIVSEENTCGMQGVNTHTLNYSSLRNIPIVQTGHEPILYHPGIWIKNHLVQHIVKKINGIGINMVVDNDAYNMGFAYIPDLSGKPPSVQKVHLVEGMHRFAYEEISLGSVDPIQNFGTNVLNLLKRDDSNVIGKKVIADMQLMFKVFINGIVECYRRGCTNMAELLTAARMSLEKEFCITNLEIPVSLISDSEGFLQYFLHIVRAADRFAGIYNRKLGEYRIIHKIRSKANPLPDIKVIENTVELPFWIWKKGEQRERCFVIHDGESMKITNGSDVFVVLSRDKSVEENIVMLKDVVKSGVKIRPRAITATMFSRLFFSEVFVHGIGGAKYDTITDEIIREFFRVEPPAFITISATFFLPFHIDNSADDSLRLLQHEIRDMVHNPENYASEGIRNDSEFKKKLAGKKEILNIIRKCGKEQKRECFYKIKELNDLLLKHLRPDYQEKQEKLTLLEGYRIYAETARFREYPTFIYPMKLLRECFLHVFSGE